MHFSLFNYEKRRKFSSTFKAIGDTEFFLIKIKEIFNQRYNRKIFKHSNYSHYFLLELGKTTDIVKEL